jgi:hypothetical protein
MQITRYINFTVGKKEHKVKEYSFFTFKRRNITSSVDLLVMILKLDKKIHRETLNPSSYVRTSLWRHR